MYTMSMCTILIFNGLPRISENVVVGVRAMRNAHSQDRRNYFEKNFSKDSPKIWRERKIVLPLHRVKRNAFAEIAQLVEHDLAKVGVASPSLVFRSYIY